MKQTNLLNKLISACITYKYNVKELYINEETLEGVAWVLITKE